MKVSVIWPRTTRPRSWRTFILVFAVIFFVASFVQSSLRDTYSIWTRALIVALAVGVSTWLLILILGKRPDATK